MLSSIVIVIVSATSLQQPGSGTPAQRAREAAFDSSRAAVARLANRVADIRSGVDVFRRAAFNGADADVLSTATNLHAECRALDSSAVVTERRVCRRCAFQPAVQRAFDGYRGAMPAVSQAGARCAARLGRLTHGADAVKLLRRDARSITGPIVQSLVEYERRLDAVLEALNAKPAPPIPRRTAPQPTKPKP